MTYIANQGDIIWMDFDPQAGREQKGRRPAIVISNSSFNRFTKVAAMVCPITKTDKGHPFHIKLDGRTQTLGTILCDQARIFDIKARNYEFIEEAPQDIVREAVAIIGGFIEIGDGEN